MLRQGILLLIFALTALGQTLVDLRTQSRGVDFTSEPSTKPLKAGTVLPPTCAQGELFFLTSATSGANLYACIPANTWVSESGGSIGVGSLILKSNGSTVGQRGTLNFLPGAALLTAMTDTGMSINIQQSIDTAVVQTLAGAQSGAGVLCASASSSATNFTCSLTPTLAVFTTNMVLNWRPDVNGAGGSTTLNIDTLGAKAIKLADGLTDPTAGDIVAGRLYPVWYDGTSFRLMIPPALTGSTAAMPACGVSTRARLWQTFGGMGVKDTVAVCAKDATDTYAWRTIY